jgi:CDP-diacylglycerol--serine O-phosphatidyltransferase
MIRRLLSALLVPPDRLLARVVGGGFGLKDLFTVINLLGGVASIGLAIQGELWWAAFAVMLGYLGDVADGPVARLTGRTNTFGTQLDTIADHTSQCVAPAFVVFLAYRDFSLGVAYALAATLVVAGSIRHARSAAAHFEFDLAWNGLPRPVAAFLVMAFINSQFFGQVPLATYVGIGLVGLVAVLNLVSLPFMCHHGRRLQPWVAAVIWSFFGVCALAALLFRTYFFDVLFAVTLAYSLGSWIPIRPEERAEFFAAARRWRAALAGEPLARTEVRP